MSHDVHEILTLLRVIRSMSRFFTCFRLDCRYCRAGGWIDWSIYEKL